MSGEIRIILGKSAPTGPIHVCLTRSRVFQPTGEELIPLVHEIYDGENETLTYFHSLEPKPGDGDMDCLELAATVFSNLDSAESRFETFVIFARKITFR